MSEEKERILNFEIKGSVIGKNLVRTNKIRLCAERGVLQQFLFEVLEEVLENIKKTGIEIDVCRENHKLN